MWLHWFWVVAEDFPTVLTFIELLSIMEFLMLKEVGILTEGLSTFLTWMWFFSSVDFLVPKQFWVISEGFPIFLAFVGLLIVNSLMWVKIWRLIEVSATFTTFITHLFYRGPGRVVRCVLTPLLPSNFLAIPSLSMAENLWSWLWSLWNLFSLSCHTAVASLSCF